MDMKENLQERDIKELNYNSVYQDKEKIESIVCRDGHSSSYIINKDKIEFKVE